MNLEWGDERKRKFATNIGLITTTGPNGDNIMAAEWTHHISYSPGLILVSIGFEKVTSENIEATGEFGVTLAAIDQNVITSVAGNSHGNEVDKIAVLKELGAKFKKGKKIKALILEGGSVTMECKVVQKIVAGDHTSYIGEIVELYPASKKESLIYYEGKYFVADKQIKKPGQDVLDKITELLEKYKRK